MAENASLEDFFGADGTEDDEGEREGEPAGANALPETATAGADPAVDGIAEGTDGEERDAPRRNDTGVASEANDGDREDAGDPGDAEGNDADDGREGVGVETGGTDDAGASTGTDFEADADAQTAGTAGVSRAAAGGTGTDPGVLATYEWSPDGVVCAACGETTERRWRDGENARLVCGSCKRW